MRLTKTTVEDLAAGDRDVFVWDERLSGFGVKVTPNGARVYVYQYRPKHAHYTRRYTIGRHGAPWTTEKARDAASDLAARVRLGEDPFAADTAQRAKERNRASKARATRAQKANERFDIVCAQFVERYAKPKNRRWAETERIFKKDVSPRWGDRSVRSITRKDVVQLIDAIDDRSPAVARSVFAQLRKLFNWCLERDLISMSPLLGLRAPPPPRARDRWLSDREIALFWRGCDALGEPFGPLFQMLLLAAQRRDEVTGMRWSELDFAKAEWIIPAARAKNRKEHVVDLSPGAIALIERRAREHELVFTTTGNTAISGHGHAKALLDLHIETVRLARAAKTPALAHWRIHDLRRTAATGMAALGHAPHVIEAVLNHASGSRGGLVAVYQHYQYRAERKAALLDWGAHVVAVVEADEARAKTEQTEN